MKNVSNSNDSLEQEIEQAKKRKMAKNTKESPKQNEEKSLDKTNNIKHDKISF